MCISDDKAQESLEKDESSRLAKLGRDSVKGIALRSGRGRYREEGKLHGSLWGG
jgi:hypothetical protein